MKRNLGNASKSRSGIYFVINNENDSRGITDRLKAAVGLCYIARLNNVPFKFIHQSGFDIRDYLAPNEVDWSAETSDIRRLPWRRKSLFYGPPFDDLPKLDPDVQYVCTSYAGKNVIEMTDVPDWQDVWRKLFWELFTPTKAVTDALASCTMPERYNTVNVRFINSLGTFERADYNAPLPPDEQARLIDKVLAKVDGCAQESDVPIIVYSDSIKFLNAAAACGFRTCDLDGVGHIGNLDVSELVCLKTFVYLFQMARSEKVYSILNLDGIPPNALYKSQYPRYAAIIGGKPFVRI